MMKVPVRLGVPGFIELPPEYYCQAPQGRLPPSSSDNERMLSTPHTQAKPSAPVHTVG